MANSMKLSIIIVSYNTKDLLIDCLESIATTVKKNSYEIVVVDNASTDGTGEAVKNSKLKVKNLELIANKENKGFSTANNQGINVSNGEYILFLNPDMIMYENTIDGMVSYMDEHKEVGAATCFLELTDGTLDDATHRGFPTPWNSFTHFSGLSKVFKKSKKLSGYSLGHEDLTKTHEIDALAGAFMLVPRSAGDEVDWWDEDYFWYGEDIDFCYKLKLAGWKIMFVPKYRALHYKGASGGIKKSSQTVTVASSSTKKKAQQARFDAMRIFYKKHYMKKYPRIVSSLVLFGIDAKYHLTKK